MIILASLLIVGCTISIVALGFWIAEGELNPFAYGLLITGTIFFISLDLFTLRHSKRYRFGAEAFLAFLLMKLFYGFVYPEELLKSALISLGMMVVLIIAYHIRWRLKDNKKKKPFNNLIVRRT